MEYLKNSSVKTCNNCGHVYSSSSHTDCPICFDLWQKRESEPEKGKSPEQQLISLLQQQLMNLTNWNNELINLIKKLS